MKKIYAVIAFLCFAAVTQVNAQAFEKGTSALNLGIGIGGSYGGGAGITSLPQFNASFEKGIWEIGGPGVVSLGGFLGYKSYKFDSWDGKWSYSTIGVRSAYHYNGIDNEKIDLYGGVMAAYYLYKYSGSYSYSGSGGGVGFSLFAGARYFFAPKFGVYAEVGGGSYNFSLLKAGIALKF